jgi:hypothetical protein
MKEASTMMYELTVITVPVGRFTVNCFVNAATVIGVNRSSTAPTARGSRQRKRRQVILHHAACPFRPSSESQDIQNELRWQAMPQEEQQSEETALTVHVQKLSNKLPSGDEHGSENSVQQSDVRRNGLKKRPGKWFMRCPRCWALMLGVILPLWLLIAVSFAFGYGLAVLEAEPELDQNDEILMNQAMGIFETVSVTNITQRLPIMCLEAFIANRTISDMADDLFIDFLPSMPYDGNLQHNFAAPPPPLITHEDVVSVFIENNANMTYNLAELLQFLQHCSASSESYVKNMIAQLTSTSSVIRATAEMSFYWNRCPLVLNETARNQSALDAFLQESIIFQSISTGYQQSLHPVG